ncbi:MAG: carboxylating nicotinate-nucleotide diphosphorylase [Candidatus Levybacteria bacterium]|nr:carboxylating nicotinate-nucleotide diphosphorylase [Candidatus Levybacteria bacterium]
MKDKGQDVNNLIKEALAEDIQEGDITTAAIIPENVQGSGIFLVKEKGIVAGLSVIEQVFRIYDASVAFTYLRKDGDAVSERTAAARVSGSAGSLLTVERTALNFLQRMSGIATLTSQFAKEIQHTGAKILDTRKTAPGLRVFDKEAVRIGGGMNHRMGLFDMFLIKDNHIAVAGSLTKAVAACRSVQSNKTIKIEVEAETIDQVQEALTCDVDMIMLDNFSLPMIVQAVKIVNKQCLLEVSGGVSLENIASIAKTGVDYISVGALTHSAKALDISFDLTLL